MIGDAGLAVEVCEAALARGVFAQAIRPPTVPPETSRLRLSVMASHGEAELRTAARVLAQATRDAGLEPGGASAQPLYDDDRLGADEPLAEAA